LKPLAITCFTGINCLGSGIDAWWRALSARASGLRPCTFEDVRLATWIGEVDGLDAQRLPGPLAEFDCRNNRLAQAGLTADGFLDAVARARARHGPARVAVLMGTSTSGVLSTERAYQRRDASGALPADFRYAGTQNNYSLGAFVRARLALEGPAAVISTACSSSAKVFGAAARMIDAGLCDAAVVGGVDSLCLTTLYGFGSLELLSPEPCRPFDAARSGISIGEGAGFALLERGGDAEILLAGWGESCDAYHMSTPHPEGLGAKLAMRRALAAAELEPAAIGYVNVHGTASRTNDVAEGLAIGEVLGGAVPVSGTKGATGHLLGAAGITEAIATMLALARGFLPGTANTRSVDPATACRVLIDGEPARIRYALTNSFGFGGNNCSLVFGRSH
jgi:3-oxoacyl-[acyl-carrier-protein] synthase-1